MYEMGLISFAAEATTDVPLTGNIQTLNAAIEGLEAKGKDVYKRQVRQQCEAAFERAGEQGVLLCLPVFGFFEFL